MKSCWVRTHNGKLSLEFRDVPVPEPGSNEILLRVHASSLNRGEFNAHYYAAEGLAQAGREAAGVVAAVGQGVTAIKPGDRIMGRARGGFAEYALLHAHEAMPVPDHLSWQQAGAVPVVFLIAYDMLYPHGRLQAGEWLLITGASSGVGVACLQMAKLIGAKAIGTSRSAEKLARLQAIGLDVGLHTSSADFAAAVRTATGGQGANLVVNNVGGSVFPECVRALAHRGRLATVSTLDGVTKCEIDLEAVHAGRLEIFGVSNRHTTLAQQAATVYGFVRDVLPKFANARVAPLVDKVFALNDAGVAKEYMESNAQVGKIVVRIS